MRQTRPCRPNSRPTADAAQKMLQEGTENASIGAFPAQFSAENGSGVNNAAGGCPECLKRSLPGLIRGRKRIQREKQCRRVPRTPQSEPSRPNSRPKTDPARKHATGPPACGSRITVRIADCVRISRLGGITGLRSILRGAGIWKCPVSALLHLRLRKPAFVFPDYQVHVPTAKRSRRRRFTYDGPATASVRKKP